MHVCYNEIEDYACDWLENLSRDNLIAPGHVDRRSIEDVVADELRGFRQVHFFAGVGVWSYALRRAGVPDDFPLWTGSCPCQPFSAAGKGGGVDDERHLWPALFHLIRERRPPVFLGEQVASKDGLGWLDLVQTDLEAAGYAIGTVDTCSAGSGAPHIRQRLRICAYDLRLASIWMGHTLFEGLERLSRHENRERGRQIEARPASETGSVISLADADQQQRNRSGNAGATGRREPANDWATCGLAYDNDDGCIAPSVTGLHNSEHHPEPCGCASGMGDTSRTASERDTGAISGAQAREHGAGFAVDGGEPVRLEYAGTSMGSRQPRPTNGFWRDADWLFCRDGKWRPVEPGTFPLVDGSAFRMGSGSAYEGKSRQGMLKAYGNAIDAEATVDFIRAALAHRPSDRVARGSLEGLLG